MENKINKKRIGDNINALAKWYGFKIKDIEEEAGVSQGYLSRLSNKNSEDSNPIVDLLLVSSQKFHVSVDSLVSLDFQKIANPDKMKLQCFFEALLYQSNRGLLEWVRNQEEGIYDDQDTVEELYLASFVCHYDKDISFYIVELEVQEEELPGYSFFIKNGDDKPSRVARYNLPGPTLYEMLRQLFEVAASNSEFVSINKASDSAIRKYMSDNKLYVDSTQEQKKYRPLYEYLTQRTENDILLTFVEVEDILGFPLPPNAFTQKAFWANNRNGQHHHCRSWMDAGFITVEAHKNTIEKMVHFKRVRDE